MIYPCEQILYSNHTGFEGKRMRSTHLRIIVKMIYWLQLLLKSKAFLNHNYMVVKITLSVSNKKNLWNYHNFRRVLGRVLKMRSWRGFWEWCWEEYWGGFWKWGFGRVLGWYWEGYWEGIGGKSIGWNSIGGYWREFRKRGLGEGLRF